MNLRPVILAGGSGKRLWPLSRNQYPKPFLTNNSQTSLIQNTVQRSLNLELALPVIVCNEQNRFLLTDHLNSISAQVEKILLEPLPKYRSCLNACSTLPFEEFRRPYFIFNAIRPFYRGR